MTMEQNLLDTMELFKAGKTGKNGNFFAVVNAVVYRDIKENHDGTFSNIQDILVIRTNSGILLGNSSRLKNLEDKRYTTKLEPSRVQRILSETISMIPFSVFSEAGLDLMTCEIVDSGPAETLMEKTDVTEFGHGQPRKKEIARHYTGARLFRAKSKNPLTLQTHKYFLCDVDRREISHGIINFFLAELPEKCGSIVEAYDMLKPTEVKNAEANGIQVQRQGEFFFIASTVKNFIECPIIRQIQVGNSRPNRVEKGHSVTDTKGNTEFYVTGTISHTGREHADLELDKTKWFKVVPNTSKANFQLTGDID